MAYYYYNSSYNQEHPYHNYQYNHSSYTDYSNSYYDSILIDPRYVQYYHHTEFHGNEYQHAPTPSLIGYYSHSSYNNNFHPKDANFHHVGDYDYDYDYDYDREPVSTEFVVSYSTIEAAANDDLDFEEYNPEPFHGGYDMSKTYGKPLPPSEEICYPPPPKFEPKPSSSLEGFSYGSIPSPYVKKDENHQILENEAKPTNQSIVPSQKIEEGDQIPQNEANPKNESIVTKVNEEEKEFDSEDEDDDYDDDEDDEDQVFEDEAKPTNESIVTKVNEEEKESDSEEEEGNGVEIRRQIPPGYGLEALDLCEGVFGGYFPCLWKRYNDQGRWDNSDDGKGMITEDNYWKKSADYLFGNPNPYGGSMPEKGSYGDPVYSYQRYYPQESLCEQVEFGGNYARLHNQGYNYGYN